MSIENSEWKWKELESPVDIDFENGVSVRLVMAQQVPLEQFWAETDESTEMWDISINGEHIPLETEYQDYAVELRTFLEKYKSAAEVEKMVLRIRIARGDSEAASELAGIIYREGKALEYICESCRQMHVGDEMIIQAMVLSYAATRVTNLEAGIHISLTGQAGTGKSHTAETVVQHLPSGAASTGGFSDKALLYHEFMPKTVLVIDDQELSEDVQQLLKQASTAWDKETPYRTVKNQTSLTLKMAAKCPFWVVKANQTGDEQILDRQLTFWITDTKEQRLSIQSAIKRSAKGISPRGESETAIVSRHIWEHIKEAAVIIPFSEEIDNDDLMDARNIQLFVSLIRAHALMHASKRRRDGREIILASIEDFKAACNIMNPILENSGGSQRLKLTPQGAKLLEVLRGMPSGTYPFSYLQELTGFSGPELSKALHGRKKEGYSSQGLMDVCNAIDIVDVTECTTINSSKRGKALDWKEHAAKSWEGTAGCFTMKRENMEKYAYLSEPEEDDILSEEEYPPVCFPVSG